MKNKKKDNEYIGTLLLVDDERDILESLSMILDSRGFKTVTASSGKEALEVFSKEPVPVIICDNSLPDTNGIDLLSEFKAHLPEVQMIMITGKATVDIAVSAMKSGVFDFIQKPVEPEHLIQLILRAKQLYNALVDKKTLQDDIERMTEEGIIGKHPSIISMLRLIHAVAPTDSTVLLEGESGTGKELVARLIHMRSQRLSNPFIAVDCGAIPEGLVESELFGHEKGSFTGAISSKPGKFERATIGTLFLDEITNLPLSSQAKILRALQEKVIERVGGQREIPVNIRLIAATNMQLQEAVRNMTFRDDLYYRLNIVRIKIPPLRERKSDILLLSMHLIEKLKKKMNARTSPVMGISKDALKIMMGYSWPGNVRELENTIEHSMIMARGTEIMPYDLPEFETHHMSHSRLDDSEKTMIIKALKDTGGNKYKAAKTLGIQRSSLYSKMKKFGIESS